MNAHVSCTAVEAGWMLDDRMTIVLFAGMGGGCDGLEAAGFHVHVAINHDPVAVAVHERRHPHTTHLRCDVFEADPHQVTKGRGVRILHASPDCTHFSVAKGSKPVSKRRRSLAWVICRWAGTVRPEVITMENVQEITTWGPLIAKRDKATGRCLKLDGTVAAKGERVPVEAQWLVPDPRHKGRIWRAWCRHMAGLGYSFEHKTLICADFGVPTIRKRFFGVARADGGEIHWPDRTHAPRKDAVRLGLLPWVGAHTIIDWSLPVRSIFSRKKPLAEATLRRTARGVMRYVVNAVKPFIVPITHAGDNRVHSVDEPLRTLTTAHRGEMSVAVPHIANFRPGSTGADVEEPLPTFTANSFEKRPGGAIPLGVVAAHMSKFNQNGDGGPADEPLDTVMAGAPRHAVVGASLIRTDQQSAAARNGVNDPEEPLNTLHTSSGIGLVAASLVDTAHGEGQGRGVSEWSLEDPLRTVGASPGKALVATILGVGGRAGQSAPRGVDEPLNTTSTKEDRVVVAASLIQTGYGERPGQAPRTLDIEEPAGTQVDGSKVALIAASLQRQFGHSVGADLAEPVPTATVGGSGKSALVAAFLAQHNNDTRRVGGVHPGREPEEPVATLTVNPQVGVIAATLGDLHGTNADGKAIEEPLATVAANGNHAHLILAFLTQYFSSGGQDQDIDNPLSAVTAKARHGLVTVTVAGVEHYIDDIGMRMLEPEEGAAAHEFPKGSLPAEITIDGRVRRLTKTEKYHLVGNSVPPRMVRLLAECNGRYELDPAMKVAAE